MKLAFISDIHSNIQAFSSVLTKIKSLDVDKIFCCGDIVGYNANPKECLDLLRKNNIDSVMGNHDLATVDSITSWFKELGSIGIEHSRKILNIDDIKFLRSLPYNKTFSFDGISFFMVHGSPRDNLFEYIHPHFSDEKIEEIGRDAMADILVFGHTHIQMEAEINHKLFLNPGSVGQPRDGIPKASFMIFDTKLNSSEWFRVPYDIKAASEAIIKAGLPIKMSDRLKTAFRK